MKIKWIYLLCSFLLFLNACNNDDSEGADITKLSPQDCPNSETELKIAEELNADYAHVFDGADPATEDSTLTPLIDFLGDAKLVGLGESTHGTSEFFKMKDKIFRQLVTKKDFKAIVFEIPWGNALKVNDFVTKGVSTAEESVDQTYYWVYNTKEVEALAQWMHDYNLNAGEDEKIFFVGCDPQGGDFKIEYNLVADYLSEVQPDSVSAVLDNYESLPTELSDYGDATADVKELNRIGTKRVFDYLEQRREEFISLTSFLEFEMALMASHVIQHREYIYRIGDSGWPRDSLMAVYSEWWQRILSPNAKVAIWAHNSHVMNAKYYNAPWMGTALRERHPYDYKIVGFSFGIGSLNAFLAGDRRQFIGTVRSQTIPEYQCNSLNQLFSLVEGDQHYIIFNEVKGESQAFFNEEHRFIQCGAGFNYKYIGNYVIDWRLSRLFDVIIHFDETSASVF